MKKVIFISSTGGHLKELMQLQPMFEQYDYHVITENTKSNQILKKTYGERMHYLVFGGKEHLFSYLFKFSFNVIKSFVLFWSIRPSYIVTTGAHTAVPMCYFGKLFGAKIIYIETYANIKTKSLSGKLVYPIADLFLVQWESMLDLYPNAVYVGGVF